jgi:hypothetical protein
MRRANFIIVRNAITDGLRDSCSSLGSNRATREMIRLSVVLLALIFAASPHVLRAQEAVSTTSGSGATSSGSASASSTTTSELSTGATAPSTAVTSSSGAPTVTGGPSGVGVFSRTPVQILASISGGYDDNVNALHSSKQGSSFTSGNVILDYTFGDPRLKLILNAGGGGSYYFEHVGGQNYDIDLKGALDITYKASPRLTLGSTLLVEYLTEPDFSAPGGLNMRNGNYLYTTDKIFAAYDWSQRFSTKTSYTFEAYNYDNNAIGAFSNRVSDTFGNEFHFQLVPTTSLGVEYRYEIVTYDDGSLDSTTHFALGGIDHIFNPRLTASLRGGAEFRSYKSDGDRTSPYFEGTVTYVLGKRVSVSWNNRYGLEEPDLTGFQSRQTFRTGFQTKFNLTSRISSTIDLYYVHDDYQASSTVVSPGFTENIFDGNLSIRYAITPLFSVQAGYHYTDSSSNIQFRDYSRNRGYAGISLTF